MSMTRCLRKTVCGAAGAAIACAVTLASPDAEAGPGESVAVAAAGLLFLSDIGFAVHDILVATELKHPDKGVSIAEIAVTAPQTLLTNALLAGFSASDREAGDIAIWVGTIPTACVTALTTHGIWSLADTPPGNALDGVSVFVGVNTALTVGTLGRAVAGSLHSRGFGIAEMVLVAPSIAVGAYESSFTRPQQTPWIALTAWSGALFVHGAVSAIVGDRWTREREANPPRSGAFQMPRVLVTPAQIQALGGSAPGMMIAGAF